MCDVTLLQIGTVGVRRENKAAMIDDIFHSTSRDRLWLPNTPMKHTRYVFIQNSCLQVQRGVTCDVSH